MAVKTSPSFVGMTPSGDVELGRVHLAPEVLEVIIGIATTEVKGVVTTKGNFATGVAEKFGKVIHGKGVKTQWTDKGLIIDVFCVVDYGHSVPTIALEIQNRIRHAIFNMTSLETSEVNVHITGIQFGSETETVWSESIVPLDDAFQIDLMLSTVSGHLKYAMIMPDSYSRGD